MRCAACDVFDVCQVSLVRSSRVVCYNAMLRHAMECCGTLCCVLICYIQLGCVMFCHARLC